MADVEAVAEVSAALSQKSLDALSLTISKALDKGLKGFGDKIAKALGKAGLDKIQKDLAASAKRYADQLDRVGTRGTQSLRGLTAGLGTTNKETLRLVRSMEALAQGQKVIEAAVKQNTTVMRQQLIDTTKQTDRANQERIRGAEAVAKRDVVITQGAEQQKVVAARFAGQQRVQLTRAVIENIARLERGLAATVAGIARTAVGATGRLFGSLTSMLGRGGASSMSSSTSSFTSSIKRMNSEMNRDLTSSLTRRERTLQSSFSRQEQILSRSALRQSQTIEKLRKQTSTGVLGAATGRGIGPGLGTLGAGVGIGALLTAGFQRFSELERLNKQFLALTGNLETTNALMAEIKLFAKETPFDLLGVADLAKGFLAIGTNAKDVLPQVRAVADAVALTGGGVEQLTRIQRAIGQVVSAGRLQGDELNQLAESLPGLNIRKILAEQFNVTVPELIKMQAAGEISGEMFVSGLINGLKSDPRLVGASEDLAKTLGGRAANLKESFADLGASIIGLFAGQIKGAILGTQMLFQGLADFIKGEDLTRGLEVLRTALGGVALGLAAVVAARGAVEVFGLLAKTVALMVTPFGLLAISAGLVGGALAVMLKQSVPFRMALESLGERFGVVAGRIRDFVGDKLSALADFVNATVIPAIIHLADWLGTKLLAAVDASIEWIDGSLIPTVKRWSQIVVRDLIGAYRATVNFITTQVIPRIRDFVDVLRAEVFPVVADVARTVASGFMAALGAVVRFGQRVWPTIKPAVDAFIQLGKAIAAAVTGDFSQLGQTALGALTGLGGLIVRAWDNAFAALRPLAGRALDAIKSVFTFANLQTVFGAILDVVEWIGRMIGTIITHPAFLAAVGAIIAGAVQLGFRFIKGFVEGVVSNIPSLFNIVKDALLDNWQTVIVGALLGAAFVGPLIRAFRSMGSASGAGFMAGLKTSMTNAVDFTRGLAGRMPFVSGVNAGPTMADVRGQQQMAVQLRAFGASNTDIGTSAGLREARRELGLLTKGMSDAMQRGLMLREGFRALGQAGGSILNSFRGQFVSISDSFRNLWTTLRATVGKEGPTVGALMGRALAGGFATGFTTFLGGKMAGKAGMGAAEHAADHRPRERPADHRFGVGAGPGAAIGTVTAAIGFAIGDAARKAGEARVRISALAETIRGEFSAALKAGTIDAVTFTNALSLGQEGQVSQAILKSIGPKAIEGLSQMGIKFDEVLNALRSGDTGQLDDLIGRLDDLGKAERIVAIQGLTRVWNDYRDAIAGVNAELAFTQKLGFADRAAFEAGRLQSFVTPGTGIFGNPNAVKSTAMGNLFSDAKNLFNDTARETRRLAADQAASRKIRGVGNQADDDRAFFLNLARVNALWDDVSAMPKPKSIELLAIDADKLALKISVIKTAMDDVFKPRGASSLTLMIDQAVLAVRDSFDELKIGGDIFDKAALNLALAGFGDQLRGVVQQGIGEGIIPTEANIRFMTGGILEALLATTTDQGVKDAIRRMYEDSVRAGAAAGLEASSTAAGLIRTEGFDELGQRVFKVPKIGADAVQVDTTAINKKLDTAGSEAGGALFSGMIRGINVGKGGAIKAAVDAANEMVLRVRQVLGVQSPSKVFEEIGRNVGEGLEIGVEDSMTTVGDKMADAIRSAVDRAVEAAKGGTAALRSAGSSLFGALTGSGGALGGGAMIGRIGGWTTALQGFLEAASSTASKAFAVALRKSEGEALTPGESNIFGESAFSLNLGDVLGAENVEALKGALDTIAGFGSEMLELGLPASDVVERLKEMRDQLLFTSGALGFNVDDIRALVDSLGLSDTALADFVTGLDSVTAAAEAAATAAKSAAMIGGLSNTTPGGMTTDEAKRQRQLTIEALTLSAEDLAVFARENGLDRNFMLNLAELQKDISDNTRDETEDLGRIFGLWGSSLSSFVDDIEAWLGHLEAVAAPWNPQNGVDPQAPPVVDPDDPALTGVTRLPRPPISVNIYPPFGDPYAIGLSAANAVAMAAMLPGS